MRTNMSDSISLCFKRLLPRTSTAKTLHVEPSYPTQHGNFDRLRLKHTERIIYECKPETRVSTKQVAVRDDDQCKEIIHIFSNCFGKRFYLSD